MQLFVTSSDELPIYRQLMRQITESIAGGQLRPGNKLPSHRDLAEQLVIAPLTVKKAYDELEALGYLETQRGRGTFVAARPPAINRRIQREQIKSLGRRFLAQAYLAGFDLRGCFELLKEADRELVSGAAPVSASANKEGS